MVIIPRNTKGTLYEMQDPYCPEAWSVVLDVFALSVVIVTYLSLI